MSQRPFILVHGDDQIADVRSRASRLERLCAELAAEVSNLTELAATLAAQPPARQATLLSVDDCARTLGLSRTTTFAPLRDGQLPSLKVGARRLVTRAGLEQFIASGLASPPTAV